MRAVFFGTSDFAAAVLRRLAAGEQRPAIVVAPPDRPRGRGRRVAAPPAAEAAVELGIELLQTENVNDPRVVARLRAAAPEVGVVCAFGQLIGESLLSELELLNIHPSLLPRWRGAAPIERAIIAGDAETGVTIMRVTSGLDSGPIALQRALPVGEDDFGALAARLERLSGELIARALELRRDGRLSYSEQDEAKATYAEKVAPRERRLDLGRPAAELVRVVRALNPHIVAYLELVGEGRLGVRRAAAEDGALARGEVATADGLRIGCARGVLRLDTVQPAGGRPMPAEAFLRGHAPPVPA